MDESASEVQGSWWQRLQAALRRRGLGARSRRLRLCETLPLGDRRFVAVIQVDDKEFLIGASSTQVQLLTQLRPESASALPSDGRSSDLAGADGPAVSVN